MDISHLSKGAAVPDVYTDVQGLQQLRNNPDKDQALRQVAQQFESLFLNMLLKNMRQANAVFEEGGLTDNNESRLIRDMYDNQLTLNMAHSQGTGLADALYRQMSGQYGTAPQPDDATAELAAADWRRTQLRAPSIADNAASKLAAGEVSAAEASPATRAAIADGPEDFIEKLLPYAKLAADKLGLSSALLLAQAALETGWGQFVLADGQGNNSHNLFNVKANSDWQGDVVSLNALEYHDGLPVQEQARFKKYSSIAASFEDFIALLNNSSRYAGAVEQASDPEAFVKGLQDAGYATDPEYAQKVMKLFREIEQNTADAQALSDPLSNGRRDSVSEGAPVRKS